MLPVALATIEPFDKHAEASVGVAVSVMVIPEHGFEGGGGSPPPPLLQEIIKELTVITMIANTLINFFIDLFLTIRQTTDFNNN